MLMTRRQFLAMSGATALVAVCSPQTLAAQPLTHGTQQNVSATLKAMQQLAQQRNRLLGYPINMTTPPEEFFAWRNELAAVGFNQFSFNNVGNPYDHSHIPFNCHPFEKELINRFGAVYGFALDDIWSLLKKYN